MNVVPRPARSPWAAGLIQPFRLIWRYRSLLWTTSVNDLRVRLAGSVLGLVWVVGYPLLLLTAYAIVYMFVFRFRPTGMEPFDYLLFVFCGLVPFLGTAEALGTGVTSVTSNATLIKNTLFPIDLIPVKAVLVSQFSQAASLVLLLIVVAINGQLTLHAFWLLPLWACQVLMLIGIAWVLGCLNIYVRELQQLVSLIVLCLMMVSPIAYTPEQVPERLQPILQVNPLYHLITGLQNCLVLGKPPEPVSALVLAAMAGVSFLVGYWFFQRMKLVFADSM
jgi:lipopolysaccharide transport system permease protein